MLPPPFSLFATGPFIAAARILDEAGHGQNELFSHRLIVVDRSHGGKDPHGAKRHATAGLGSKPTAEPFLFLCVQRVRAEVCECLKVGGSAELDCDLLLVFFSPGRCRCRVVVLPIGICDRVGKRGERRRRRRRWRGRGVWAEKKR